MMGTLFDSLRNPSATTELFLQDVAMVRVWDDYTFSAFHADGSTLLFLQHSTYWGFLWQ